MGSARWPSGSGGSAVINTVSTGLTLSSGTLTGNLSTGVSGGQTIIGGTGSGDDLTYSSTSHATKGSHIWGSTSGMVYDEANVTLIIGTSSPPAIASAQVNKSQNSASAFIFSNPSSGGNAYSTFMLGNTVDISGAYFAMELFGSGSTRGAPYGVNSAVIELGQGSANMVFWIAQASGDFVWNTGTTFPNPTERMRLTNGGALTFPATGTFGAFGATAAAQQASAANLTNNVTSGGTDNTIANYTDLTVYANDAAAIRNNIYQLARKLKQVNDGLRVYGWLT